VVRHRAATRQRAASRESGRWAAFLCIMAF
jgi:hypothetical protein